MEHSGPLEDWSATGLIVDYSVPEPRQCGVGIQVAARHREIPRGRARWRSGSAYGPRAIPKGLRGPARTRGPELTPFQEYEAQLFAPPRGAFSRAASRGSGTGLPAGGANAMDLSLLPRSGSVSQSSVASYSDMVDPSGYSRSRGRERLNPAGAQHKGSRSASGSNRSLSSRSRPASAASTATRTMRRGRSRASSLPHGVDSPSSMQAPGRAGADDRNFSPVRMPATGYTPSASAGGDSGVGFAVAESDTPYAAWSGQSSAQTSAATTPRGQADARKAVVAADLSAQLRAAAPERPGTAPMALNRKDDRVPPGIAIPGENGRPHGTRPASAQRPTSPFVQQYAAVRPESPPSPIRPFGGEPPLRSQRRASSGRQLGVAHGSKTLDAAGQGHREARLKASQYERLSRSDGTRPGPRPRRLEPVADRTARPALSMKDLVKPESGDGGAAVVVVPRSDDAARSDRVVRPSTAKERRQRRRRERIAQLSEEQLTERPQSAAAGRGQSPRGRPAPLRTPSGVHIVPMGPKSWLNSPTSAFARHSGVTAAALANHGREAALRPSFRTHEDFTSEKHALEKDAKLEAALAESRGRRAAAAELDALLSELSESMLSSHTDSTINAVPALPGGGDPEGGTEPAAATGDGDAAPVEASQPIALTPAELRRKKREDERSVAQMRAKLAQEQRSRQIAAERRKRAEYRRFLLEQKEAEEAAQRLFSIERVERKAAKASELRAEQAREREMMMKKAREERKKRAEQLKRRERAKRRAAEQRLAEAEIARIRRGLGDIKLTATLLGDSRLAKFYAKLLVILRRVRKRLTKGGRKNAAREARERHKMAQEEWHVWRQRWYADKNLGGVTRADGAWVTVRVFISSTFNDMHGERDVLTRTVFPALNELLRPRRVHVVPVDLRWGLTAEDTSDAGLGALEHCLLEVNVCHPFFLILSGERYGWIDPRGYRVSDDPSLQWVKSFEPGHSITAMEIYHAFLRKTLVPTHAFAYFRDPSFIKEIDDPSHRRVFSFDHEGEPGIRERAEELRQQIMHHPYCKSRSYKCTYGGVDAHGKPQTGGLQGFEAAVLEDLFSAISYEFPLPTKPVGALELERCVHRHFAVAVSRKLVGRARVVESLASVLVSVRASKPALPVVLIGESGTGKSTVLASISERAGELFKGAYVVPHFVGASPESTDIRQTLLRIWGELSLHFHVAMNPESDEYPHIREGFLHALERAGAKALAHDRFVLLIVDAVEQFHAQYNPEDMSWLPGYCPPGVRVLLSTTGGSLAMDHLLQREPPPKHVMLAEMELEERRELVRRVLVTFRKRLTAEQEDMLLRKTDARKPVYLMAACEELRLVAQFGVDGQGVMRLIERLPPLIHELLDMVLVRVENDMDTWAKSAPENATSVATVHKHHRRRPNEPRRGGLVRLASSNAVGVGLKLGIGASLNRPGLPAVRRASALSGVELAELSDSESSDAESVSSTSSSSADERGEGPGAKLVRVALCLLHCSRNGLTEDQLLELLAPEGSERLQPAIWSRMYRTLEMYIRPPGSSGTSTLQFFHDQFREAVKSRYFAHGRSAERATYGKLSAYLQGKADPIKDGTWLCADSEVFDDLVYYQRQALQLNGLRDTLGNLQFVRARATHGTDGLERLLRDYHDTIAMVKEVKYTLLKAHFGGQTGAREDIIKWLREFLTFVASNFNRLAKHPTLTFQYAINQPDDSAPYHQACKLMRYQCVSLIVERAFRYKLAHAQPEGAGNSVVYAALRKKYDENKIVEVTPRRWIMWGNKPQRNRVIAQFSGLKSPISTAGCLPSKEATATVAVGHDNGILHVLDVHTGKVAREFTGSAHKSKITTLQYSFDARVMVSGDVYGTLAVWDTRTGAVITSINEHERSVTAVQFIRLESAQVGDRGAYSFASAAQDNSLRVFQELPLPSGPVYECVWSHDWMSATPLCLAFSLENQALMVGHADGTVNVWDTHAINLGLVPLGKFVGHSFVPTSAMACARGGDRLATGGGNGDIKVWVWHADQSDGKAVQTLSGSWLQIRMFTRGHAKAVTCIAFSPEGNKVVSSALDHTIIITDAVRGIELLTMRGHTDRIAGVAFIGSEDRVVSTSADQTVKLWDSSTVDVATKQAPPVKQAPKARKSKPTEALAATRDAEQQDWPFAILCTEVSAKGDKAISGSRSGELKVWGLDEAREEILLMGHEAGVSAVEFSRGGEVFISGDEQGVLNVWNGDTYDHMFTFSSVRESVLDIAVCRGVEPGTFLSIVSFSDAPLKVYDVTAGAELDVGPSHELGQVTRLRCLLGTGERGHTPSTSQFFVHDDWQTWTGIKEGSDISMEELERLVARAGLREHEAATTIQSAVRGQQVRAVVGMSLLRRVTTLEVYKMHSGERENSAATTLQSAVRKRLAVKELRARKNIALSFPTRATPAQPAAAAASAAASPAESPEKKPARVSPTREARLMAARSRRGGRGGAGGAPKRRKKKRSNSTSSDAGSAAPTQESRKPHEPPRYLPGHVVEGRVMEWGEDLVYAFSSEGSTGMVSVLSVDGLVKRRGATYESEGGVITCADFSQDTSRLAVGEAGSFFPVSVCPTARPHKRTLATFDGLDDRLGIKLTDAADVAKLQGITALNALRSGNASGSCIPLGDVETRAASRLQAIYRGRKERQRLREAIAKKQTSGIIEVSSPRARARIERNRRRRQADQRRRALLQGDDGARATQGRRSSKRRRSKPEKEADEAKAAEQAEQAELRKREKEEKAAAAAALSSGSEYSEDDDDALSDDEPQPAEGSATRALAFSADGKLLAVGREDGAVFVLDAARPHRGPLSEYHCQSGVTAIAMGIAVDKTTRSTVGPSGFSALYDADGRMVRPPRGVIVVGDEAGAVYILQMQDILMYAEETRAVIVRTGQDPLAHAMHGGAAARRRRK